MVVGATKTDQTTWSRMIEYGIKCCPMENGVRVYEYYEFVIREGNRNN